MRYQQQLQQRPRYHHHHHQIEMTDHRSSIRSKLTAVFPDRSTTTTTERSAATLEVDLNRIIINGQQQLVVGNKIDKIFSKRNYSPETTAEGRRCTNTTTTTSSTNTNTTTTTTTNANINTTKATAILNSNITTNRTNPTTENNITSTTTTSSIITSATNAMTAFVLIFLLTSPALLNYAEAASTLRKPHHLAMKRDVDYSAGGGSLLENPNPTLDGVYTGMMKYCPPSTPCGWAVYIPATRRVDYFMKNTCSCKSDKICLKVDDDLSVSAYVYKCMERSLSTENDALTTYSPVL